MKLLINRKVLGEINRVFIPPNVVLNISPFKAEVKE